MESIVAQRIRSVLEQKQISIAAFAKRIGMQQVTCNRQIRGDQAVSLGLIEGFLREFKEISAEWVMRGTGNMYLDEPKKKVVDVAPILGQPAKEDSLWQAKYEELEKRYDQLLGILGGSVCQK